jgi:hypothetical protein
MTTAKSNAFLDALDLGEALRRSCASVRGMHGTEARIKGLALLAVAAGLTPLVWYFDVQPTANWIGGASGNLLASLPAALALAAPLFGVLLHLLPTLFETVLPRGVIFADWLTYGAAAFDATTDWPRVRDTMEAAWSHFAAFGPLQGAAWHIARILLLAMATIGFEIIWVVCVVCGFMLLIQSFRGP